MELVLLEEVVQTEAKKFRNDADVIAVIERVQHVNAFTVTQTKVR